MSEGMNAPERGRIFCWEGDCAGLPLTEHDVNLVEKALDICDGLQSLLGAKNDNRARAEAVVAALIANDNAGCPSGAGTTGESR